MDEDGKDLVKDGKVGGSEDVVLPKTTVFHVVKGDERPRFC